MKSTPRLPGRVVCILLLFSTVAACTSPSTSTPTSSPTTPPLSVAQAVPTPPNATAILPTLQSTSTAVPSATSVAGPSSDPLRQPSATPSATPAARGFDGEAAHHFDQVLASQIGSRPGGSAALAEAATYIEDQLQTMGYTVRLQPYTVTSFTERSAGLVVTQPQRVEVAASALTYSGSGEVDAPLVYCGLGRPSDFPSAGVRGKIAIVDRGEITFQSKVDAAVARGASGVIIANDRDGELRGSLAQAGKIPVVSILRADGQRLREMMRRGPVQATLAVDASTSTREGQNIIATRESTSSARKKIVIGAHYDTVAAGPGANDNGSGVSVMLEFARLTRDRAYPFDLTFVAFGDEEIGLVGSKRYVESLSRQERGQITAMLDFDMVGVGTAMEFGGDKALAAQATRAAQSLGYRTQPLTAKSNQSSDYSPFMEAGVPAVFFYRAEDPNYHTGLDTADRVSAANLAAAGNVATALLNSITKR